MLVSSEGALALLEEALPPGLYTAPWPLTPEWSGQMNCDFGTQELSRRP
jgi:hypothetical protein